MILGHSGYVEAKFLSQLSVMSRCTYYEGVRKERLTSKFIITQP